MNKGIHFISGLPRSGSTLLAALLRQNPKFHAGMSTAVGPLFATMQSMLSGRSEYYVFIDAEKRRAILRSLFDSYYSAEHHDKTVFDTNRGWCSKVAAIDELFPSARIICCVRSLVWIFDSFERLIHRNPLEPSRLFNYEGVGNVFTRVSALNSPNGLVRSSYNSLKDAFYGEHSHKLLLVSYESLTMNPADTMSAIYKFLGESSYEHDFENVELDVEEFDVRFGTRGLHAVKRKVEFVSRSPALPPELVAEHEKSAFWAAKYKYSSRAQVI